MYVPIQGWSQDFEREWAEISHRRQLYVYRNRINSSIIYLGNYENCESKERLRSSQLNTFCIISRFFPIHFKVPVYYTNWLIDIY